MKKRYNNEGFEVGQLVNVKGMDMPMQIEDISDELEFYTVIPPFSSSIDFISMGFYADEIKPLMHTIVSQVK